MWKPDICVYHGNCDDGFGAAWVVRRRWAVAGHDVTFVPGVYGKPIDWPELAGRHVLFVDFSLKREAMIALARGQIGGGDMGASPPASIVVLDHHKTAEAELKQWDIGPVRSFSLERAADDIAQAVMEQGYPILAHFDMDCSGAHMAWDFAFPEEDMPQFIRLIEDRDLWRFAFGELTKQFSATLRTYAQDFTTWDVLVTKTGELIDEGGSILRSHDSNIAKFLTEAYEGWVGGHVVPMVNVPYHYASDAAHALLQKYPDAPFTAAWFRRGDGMVQWSLRSEDARMDVSEVAKLKGGGGHRNAAGFTEQAWE